ncbi:TPA: hypothetical protein OT937_002214 [Pseudomonas aeruginosa]|nr:hypothetical protein [Pseudomonas aeruginosa]
MNDRTLLELAARAGANETMLWTDGDRPSATRRAIVRAAAEIGKSM